MKSLAQWILNGVGGASGLMLVGLMTMPLTTFGDGTVDGVIAQEYGSTNNQDLDQDGNCGGEAFRGDIIDFSAYSDDAGTSSPGDDNWHFAWVIDSSHDLLDTVGNFFGTPANNTVTYLIGIDAGCDGAPSIDMNAGTPWRRFFSWEVDYFIGLFPATGSTLTGQLYDNTKTAIGPTFTAVSTTPGFRRQFEFALPNDPAIPVEFRNNTEMCMMIVSTYNTDGAPVQWRPDY